MSIDREFKVEISITLNNDDIENIIVGAFEGGINYWCSHIHDYDADGKLIREGKPKHEPLSTWCAQLLMDGRTVILVDVDETHYRLTMDRLLEGIKLNHINRPWSNHEDYDAEDYDSIIQYALFGTIEFS